ARGMAARPRAADARARRGGAAASRAWLPRARRLQPERSFRIMVDEGHRTVLRRPRTTRRVEGAPGHRRRAPREGTQKTMGLFDRKQRGGVPATTSARPGAARGAGG